MKGHTSTIPADELWSEYRESEILIRLCESTVLDVVPGFDLEIFAWHHVVSMAPTS